MAELTTVQRETRIAVRNQLFELATGKPIDRENLVRSFRTAEEQGAANEYIDILLSEGKLEQTGSRLMAGMDFERL